MLGHKARIFTSRLVSLEDLVPPDHFYRQVEQRFNLQFVRDLVCKYYAPFGRPSIDPIVFFKLQLIAFFECIRSERHGTREPLTAFQRLLFIAIPIGGGHHDSPSRPTCDKPHPIISCLQPGNIRNDHPHPTDRAW